MLLLLRSVVRFYHTTFLITMPMPPLKPTLYIVACFLFLGHALYSQTPESVVVAEDKYSLAKDRFEKRWKGVRFPLPEALNTETGKNLGDNGRSKFVFFGFSTCMPCKYQLPKYIRFARKYPKVDFFYCTFDGEAIVLKELQELGFEKESLPENMHLVSLERSVIDESKLTNFGYPVKYFLNSMNVIINVDASGNYRQTEEQLHEDWLTKMSFL